MALVWLLLVSNASARLFVARKLISSCLLLIAAVVVSPVARSVEAEPVSLQHSGKFKRVDKLKWVKVDLRYASNRNFMRRNLYGNFNKAWLHIIAWNKLKKASILLQRYRPGYRLLVFDALRPLKVQRALWNQVKGSDKQKYVADPRKGSIHNFGFAVDLTIIDNNNRPLDMGTRFDSFHRMSQPRLEKTFLASGKLSRIQYKNRLLLRKVMTDAGFIQLPLEWWHFDALPAHQIRKRYSIVR